MIEERPATVLSVAAIRSGFGRVWQNQSASLVELSLIPGEPQGFGEPEALLELLEAADGWTCVEVDADLARALAPEFDRRFGLAREVIDVIHTLEVPPPPYEHELVRRLEQSDLALEREPADVLPFDDAVGPAIDAGRVFGAVDGRRLVGQGGSLMCGEWFTDVGVHVAEAYRRQGIGTAAAAAACHAVQHAGLTPVWGCGAHNDASLAVAAKLGFAEVERLTFLVRAR